MSTEGRPRRTTATVLRSIALAIWDFVVGDDWRTAAGVVVGLAVTALAAHTAQIAAWWVTPVFVIVLLAISLRRAAGP